MSDLTEKMTVIRETREIYEKLRIAEKRIAELERKYGDGSVPVRFHALIYELRKQFPICELDSSSPELRLLALIDTQTAEVVELRRLLDVALEAMKYVAVEYKSQVLINAIEILEGIRK